MAENRHPIGEFIYAFSDAFPKAASNAMAIFTAISLVEGFTDFEMGKPLHALGHLALGGASAYASNRVDTLVNSSQKTGQQG